MLSTTSNSASLCFAALLLCAKPALTAPPALARFEAVEPHMGTLFRIELYAPDKAVAQKSFTAAFARIAALDQMLSDYNPASELSRLSSAAPRTPVPVSHDLFTVLAAAQALAADTGGAFDVTLGPVIRLWRTARKSGVLPDSGTLAQARARSGFHSLVLDPRARTVTLQLPNMQLDVGGIAKGYAADEALAVLKRCGIRSALVAASGDLAFSSAPPGKTGWQVGVDSFDRSDAPFTVIITLAHAAVSTSGDTEQYVNVGGVRYSHIIDPATGLGLTRQLTVTTVSRSGLRADGLATALSVLGLERGLPFAEKRGEAALFAVRGPHPVVRSTQSFKKLQ